MPGQVYHGLWLEFAVFKRDLGGSDLSAAVQVKQLYTAPTLIRALIGAGDAHVKKADRSSLRVLGSVGEPINPYAWHWFHSVRRMLYCRPFFWVSMIETPCMVEQSSHTSAGCAEYETLPGCWCSSFL